MKCFIQNLNSEVHVNVSLGVFVNNSWLIDIYEEKKVYIEKVNYPGTSSMKVVEWLKYVTDFLIKCQNCSNKIKNKNNVDNYRHPMLS